MPVVSAIFRWNSGVVLAYTYICRSVFINCIILLLIQFLQRPIFVRRKSLHVGMPLVNACQCHGFVTKIQIVPMEQTSQLAVSLPKWFIVYVCVVWVWVCFGCILLQLLLLNPVNGRYFITYSNYWNIRFNFVEKLPHSNRIQRSKWNESKKKRLYYKN